jgi:hypothetical protein
VVSFTPWLLYPQGKSPPYPLDRRLGGPQSHSDVVVKRKIPRNIYRFVSIVNALKILVRIFWFKHLHINSTPTLEVRDLVESSAFCMTCFMEFKLNMNTWFEGILSCFIYFTPKMLALV